MSVHPLLAHFNQLLEYEIWANSRTLDAIDSIPAANRHGPAYSRALGLLPHNLLARQVWLWRLTATPYPNPSDWFPPQSTDDTREQAQRVDDDWRRYLASLDPASLEQSIHYTSSEGVRYSSRVADVLAHVFNHSTYHRGQIARIVTECGGKRPSTDFIAFSRQSAPAQR